MDDRYASLFDLSGKVVWVVGASGAIGGEMARALAAYGARVAVSGRSLTSCQPTVDAIREADGQAIAVAVDVQDEASIQAAADRVEAELGAVDILINSAGTHIEEPAEAMSAASWDKVLDVNLKGAFLLSQAAARSMIAHEVGGSIVHVTSVRSALGIRRGYAAYVASKGGLGVLIKQLASEWAEHGIRVNGIAPTFTRTPLVEGYLSDPEFYEKLVQRIPMGRVCETIDLAGIAVFLASDSSSFITGQNIFVDGGVVSCQ